MIKFIAFLGGVLMIGVIDAATENSKLSVLLTIVLFGIALLIVLHFGME
jgi:hypothetical protein